MIISNKGTETTMFRLSPLKSNEAEEHNRRDLKTRTITRAKLRVEGAGIGACVWLEPYFPPGPRVLEMEPIEGKEPELKHNKSNEIELMCIQNRSKRLGYTPMYFA